MRIICWLHHNENAIQLVEWTFIIVRPIVAEWVFFVQYGIRQTTFPFWTTETYRMPWIWCLLPKQKKKKKKKKKKVSNFPHYHVWAQDNFSSLDLYQWSRVRFLMGQTLKHIMGYSIMFSIWQRWLLHLLQTCALKILGSNPTWSET